MPSKATRPSQPLQLLSRLTAQLKGRTAAAPPREPAHVVIEHLSPSIDLGAFPVKRVVGDDVHVEADIYKDGHDRIGARPEGSGAFRHSQLRYEFNPDRWYGSFEVDRVGLWEFTIEAWPDAFGTWCEDLKKRVDAGQDIASELLEGALMIRRRAQQVTGSAVRVLEQAARDLSNAELSVSTRLDVAFANNLAELMFGPLEPLEATRTEPFLQVVVDRPQAAFAAWYELFPRSQTTSAGRHGTFRDTEARLADIAALGFDVLYLPPIHPIGVTHRKGKNNSRVAEPGDVGSPWGIGSEEGGHDAVHPELGTLEDFRRLVRSAQDLGLEIALDFALQCSPDHPWVKEHPEWFYIRADGSIRYAENPPKKYEDIYPLNFWCRDRAGLWNACKDLVLFWIDQGVRTFRVDNPHTKPLEFWRWLIADVKSKHADVVFLAEAFTRPKRMRGLAKLGFTQSYTYFTWKNTKEELIEYLEELTGSEMREYYRPNFFANTPDILHAYLQHGGKPAFRIRLVLAATLSPVYGIYSGFELCEGTPVREGSEEYLDSEKYQIRVRDWRAPGGIRDDVARVNRIRRENPALQALANLTFLDTDSNHILAYLKRAPGNDLIVVVNLDPHGAQETMVTLPLEALGLGGDAQYEVLDALTGVSYTWRGRRNYVRLDPNDKVAHVFVLQR